MPRSAPHRRCARCGSQGSYTPRSVHSTGRCTDGESRSGVANYCSLRSLPINRSRIVSAELDLECCNRGTVMAMAFGWEELLCGSCDVDDGHDKRDDPDQGGDDGYELSHEGDGGAKGKA